jgi:transcriptional regulator with XRE-family HTH domain
MKTTMRVVARVNPRWLNREIGKRLRVVRKRKGLTLAEVGIGVGVSRAAVNNWELGQHQANFVVTTLYNLALFYRVPVRRLLP